MATRRWYGRDSGLTARMFLTMFLLTAVYIAFLALLWRLGVSSIGLILIAAVLAGVQYFFSDKMVLWSMGAKIVSPTEAPELHSMVDRLAASVNLPKPRVAIVDTAMPNAFATGRGPKHSTVAVTTGLISRLSGPELEAVLAHEMSHVKNRDVMVITLASFMATVAFILMRSFLFTGMMGGYRGRRDQGGSVLIIIYLASLLVWVISFFLIRAISRYREYAADRGGAIITGAPSRLASALVKISSGMSRIPDRDMREVGALNAFFIMPAVSRSSLIEAFSTHPSLEHRLARLEKMQQQMEGV